MPPKTLLVALLLVGCPAAPARDAPAASSSAVARAPTAESPAVATSTAPSAAVASASQEPTSCGPLECTLFDSPAAAFARILEDKPLVVAIGEAHAQKGSEAWASTAKRFTADVLPTLQGRASDLLVELLQPPTGCKQKTEAVREKQKQVTEKQASTDQNEYVAMGEAARKLGVVPDLLRPTCADLDAIDAAGAGAIEASLGLIARLTRSKVEDLLGRNAKAGVEKIVLTYGGAMHNDVAPTPERAPFSFGPALMTSTKGRYAEVDVFVPEQVSDGEAWKKLPWYPHYDKAAHPDKATLYHPAPGSWVLLFPAFRR